MSRRIVLSTGSHTDTIIVMVSDAGECVWSGEYSRSVRLGDVLDDISVNVGRRKGDQREGLSQNRT